MLIEIWTKKSFAENQKKSLLINFESAGFNFKKAESSKLYEISGKFDKTTAKKIAETLLIDKITESFSLSKPNRQDYSHRIEVWFKSSLTDVVAESVEKAVSDMGFGKISVKCGEVFYIKTAKPLFEIRKAVNKTLINSLINDYTVKEL